MEFPLPFKELCWVRLSFLPFECLFLCSTVEQLLHYGPGDRKLSSNPIDSSPKNGDETSFIRVHCDVSKHVLLSVYSIPSVMQCIISPRGGFYTGVLHVTCILKKV
jgi:hypothetical protein